MEEAFADCDFVTEDFVEFAQKPTPLPPESPGVIAGAGKRRRVPHAGTSQSTIYHDEFRTRRLFRGSEYTPSPLTSAGLTEA